MGDGAGAGVAAAAGIGAAKVEMNARMLKKAPAREQHGAQPAPAHWMKDWMIIKAHLTIAEVTTMPILAHSPST